jgi:hypothetical protein
MEKIKEGEALKQEEAKLAPEKEPLKLTPEQQARYDLHRKRLEHTKQQRNQPREEFDDMTYEQDYFYNKRAANSYLPKKLNDDEVRVNTGTIEKKVEVLINELVSMNLQPEAKVYDAEDNEIAYLGKDFIDIVRRTNEIEKDDDFWIDFLKEMLSQRSVFIQEQFVEQKYKSTKIYRATKRLISGLRVYLGDINIPARLFQTQPFVILYTRRNYDEARTIYGDWENWQHVTAGPNKSADQPFGYRMNVVTADEVEEIHEIDPINNEYYITINGVPMMPTPKTLPWSVTPDRCYNMTQIVVKPLDTDFAHGKSPVNSAKFLQGFKDEWIRLIIEKARQGVRPPYGVKSGRIISKDIWAAGTVTQGVSKETFSKLTDHDGVTNSEYSMTNFIEQEIEKFIGAGTLGAPTNVGPEKTATQNQQEQVNSIKNLGLIVMAFMRAKRDSTYLRIYNVAENFVAPRKNKYDPLQDKITSVFSRFTIPDTIFENGKKGKKIVQFTDTPLTREEKEGIYAYEQKEASLGRPVQIRAINVDLLKAIPLFWCVVVNPTPRDGSQLQKVLFKDMLEQGAVIQNASQGQKQVNWEKAAERFEKVWDTKDFFKKEAPQQQQPGMPQQTQPEDPNIAMKGEDILKEIGDFERSAAGSEMTESMRRQNQPPSINRLEDNVG